MKKTLLSALVLLLLGTGPVMAAEAVPYKIGDVSLYTKAPLLGRAYKAGIELAVQEINAKGGVNGRPLAIISRDSKNSPAEAVKIADELLSRERISVLMNADASNATLAISNWAKHNKIPFIDTISDADGIIWANGNDYVFRIVWGGYNQMSGMFDRALELYGDKIKGKRWAIVAPNYEYGHAMVDAAKAVAKEKGLKAEWVAEQWPPLLKMDAGATVAAIERANPDIILAPLAETDLFKFVREGGKRGLFKNRVVISPMAGFPEYLDVLKSETPQGWIVTGFPAEDIRDFGFVRFREAYQAATGELPQACSLLGYQAVYAIAAALEKAKSDDPAKIRDALETVSFRTPFGDSRFRKIDHQATSNFWVGVTGVKNGQGKLLNWQTKNVADTSPSDAWIEGERSKADEGAAQ